MPGTVVASVEVSGELHDCDTCLHRFYSQERKMGELIDN